MARISSRSHDPLALGNQFCFALYSATAALRKIYRPFLDALGLTYPQYLVMLVLWQQDDLPVKAICEQLYADAGTLAPLLKRLEAAGLIGRRRGADDERHPRIVLTEHGRALRKKAQQLPLQVSAASGQPQAALGHLRAQLSVLRDDLIRAAH